MANECRLLEVIHLYRVDETPRSNPDFFKMLLWLLPHRFPHVRNRVSSPFCRGIMCPCPLLLSIRFWTPPVLLLESRCRRILAPNPNPGMGFHGCNTTCARNFSLFRSHEPLAPSRTTQLCHAGPDSRPKKEPVWQPLGLMRASRARCTRASFVAASFHCSRHSPLPGHHVISRLFGTASPCRIRTRRHWASPPKIPSMDSRSAQSCLHSSSSLTARQMDSPKSPSSGEATRCPPTGRPHHCPSTKNDVD